MAWFYMLLHVRCCITYLGVVPVPIMLVRVVKGTLLHISYKQQQINK